VLSIRADATITSEHGTATTLVVTLGDDMGCTRVVSYAMFGVCTHIVKAASFSQKGFQLRLYSLIHYEGFESCGVYERGTTIVGRSVGQSSRDSRP